MAGEFLRLFLIITFEQEVPGAYVCAENIQSFFESFAVILELRFSQSDGE